MEKQNMRKMKFQVSQSIIRCRALSVLEAVISFYVKDLKYTHFHLK